MFLLGINFSWTEMTNDLLPFLEKSFVQYRATIISLLLPFLVFALTSVTSFSLYSFSLPLNYLLISAVPLWGMLIKVNVNISADELSIVRSFLGFKFHYKSYTVLVNEQITWKSSKTKENIHTLFVGE